MCGTTWHNIFKDIWDFLFLSNVKWKENNAWFLNIMFLNFYKILLYVIYLLLRFLGGCLDQFPSVKLDGKCLWISFFKYCHILDCISVITLTFVKHTTTLIDYKARLCFLIRCNVNANCWIWYLCMDHKVIRVEYKCTSLRFLIV